MDLGTYLLPALFGALASALTFGACWWWHARRSRELLGRLDKSDRARATASQQAQQARRQIEQLQKELAAQHKARAEAVSARKRAQQVEPTVREPSRDLSASLLAFDAPAMPASGFADTMPFTDATGATP